MPVEASRVRRQNRTGFVLVAALILVMIVLIPFGLIDLIVDVSNPSTEKLFTVTPIEAPDAATTTYNRVHVDVTAIDELGETMTLRVSGTHFCKDNCAARDKIVFYSIDPFGRDEEGLPANDSITLPTTPTQFSATLKLPIGSSLFRYPFDTDTLTLGLSLERIGADNKSVVVPVNEARGQLFVTVRDKVNRLRMDDPDLLNAADVRPLKVDNFDYVAASDLTFHRSNYLKALVIAVLLLITTAVSYAVFLRTFDQVITNAGPIVLGIYGVRVLILGGFPTDVTAVDLILTGLVTFFLLITAARGLSYFQQRSGWRIPGFAPPPEPKE
ncbi:MAG: hypothetical protein M3Z19_17420 [Chloroflexota bacterium]|nr:hypothetical protein [Chloroflexota bacterium]